MLSGSYFLCPEWALYEIGGGAQIVDLTKKTLQAMVLNMARVVRLIEKNKNSAIL